MARRREGLLSEHWGNRERKEALLGETILGGKWQLRQGGHRAETHKICAATVETIAVQVAVPITGQENATQLPIPSCVKRVIGSEDQQPGHISPANLLLEVEVRREPWATPAD